MLGRIGGAVGLAEGMAACDERYGFIIVHRHPAKGFANVAGSGERIGVSVRSLRIHVDESHLNGAERIFKLSVAGVTLIAEPFVFRAPIDVFLRLPNVRATAAETKCLKSH